MSIETAMCLVAIDQTGSNIIVKDHVTPAEVAVLRMIHGEDAVTDIRVYDEPALNEAGEERTEEEELERLALIYNPMNSADARMSPVNQVFGPTATARPYKKFSEVRGLGDQHFSSKPKIKTETKAEKKAKEAKAETAKVTTTRKRGTEKAVDAKAEGEQTDEQKSNLLD